MRLRGALAVALALLLGTSAALAAPADRYALAGGCFTVSTAAGPLDLAPLRFEPTRLGEYLLYTPTREFVAAGDDGSIVRTATPSPAAEWRVTGTPTAGFTLTNVGTTASRAGATFTTASGCADYPEAQLGLDGPLPAPAFPTGAVRGMIDTHMHIAAFEIFGGEWHCGTPWHPYGAPYALPDCTDKRRGTNGTFADTLETGSPIPSSDRVGWPTFVAWPKPTAVASESDYYTSLERAWRGGVRILVQLAVDNEELCSVMSQRRRACNDMASAHAQIKDIHELVNYVDAQFGGPGKGFLRIVRDPFEARRVINRGQVAVVLGIEVSRLFGCGQHLDVPECDRGDVEAGLREARALGVSTLFPVHKFDNAFGGTKMDAGVTAAIVEAGNIKATGQKWSVETCSLEEFDNDIPSSPQVPTPHCNTRGLTDLGAYLVGRMVDEGLLVEVDHMSVKTVHAVLDILEKRGYSGLVSSHQTESQLSAAVMPRIARLGGFISPTANPVPADWLGRWKQARAARGGRGSFPFGIGFGSDINGLAAQSHPGDESGDKITYPFRSLDGTVSFGREVWGERSFDINRDGVATYGMYADWVEQVRRRGGETVAADLLNGADAYLGTWERARGIAPTACRPAKQRLTSLGLGRLKLGMRVETVLRRAGQPSSRPGRAYRWCAAGSKAAARPVRVVFGDGERVVLVASTARGHATASGVAPGRRARGRAARSGIRIGPRLVRGARIVRGVRGGRVRWVAAVAATTVRSPVRLRRALRSAGLG